MALPANPSSGTFIPTQHNIVSSTNATPIVVTDTAHGFSTNDTVYIVGHATNTNANGSWTITVVNANSYSLNNSVGNGVGGATGTVMLTNEVSLCTVVITSTNRLKFDRAAMVAGDGLELRWKEKLLTGGAQRGGAIGRWYGAPLPGFEIEWSDWVENVNTDTAALEFTVRPIYGVSHSYPWSLFQWS